ncbi:MAG: lytic transglycosylase domain-containing protein [Bacillota bacterium]|nr:lytic transglycosylase domain-containing protein [Bacillota bacterium]
MEDGEGLASQLAAAIRAGGTSMGPGEVSLVAETIVREGRRHQLDPWLIYAVIRHESGFNPEARGAAGEIGLMQILPSTARWIHRNLMGGGELQLSALFDPVTNVRYGTAYLARLIRQNGGDVALALTAYNAGSTWAAPSGYALAVLTIVDRVHHRLETPAPPAAAPARSDPPSPPSPSSRDRVPS